MGEKVENRIKEMLAEKEEIIKDMKINNKENEEEIEVLKKRSETLDTKYKSLKLLMEINKEELIETNRVKDLEMERIRAEQMSLEAVHGVLTKTLAEKDEKT